MIKRKLKFNKRINEISSGFDWVLGGLHIKTDMKIDWYETEKSHIAFLSSLSKCLHALKWYEIHIGVDFISVILTELKFNTQYELFCLYTAYRFAHGNMKIDNNYGCVYVPICIIYFFSA